MDIRSYQTHCLKQIDMLDSEFEQENFTARERELYELIKPHLIHSMRQWAELPQAIDSAVYDGFSFFIRGLVLGLKGPFQQYMALLVGERQIDLFGMSAAGLSSCGAEPFVVAYLTHGGGDSVFVWEDEGPPMLVIVIEQLQVLTEGPQEDDGLWLAQGIVAA